MLMFILIVKFMGFYDFIFFNQLILFKFRFCLIMNIGRKLLYVVLAQIQIDYVDVVAVVAVGDDATVLI